ncbi:hypothetical protein J4573_21425 [Actinomadura barringtoniae]|uniref:Cobyrinic acid a,c-diamide synthase n=1 Tax=Actinomadura barringtoniae TaxID=1427535 RepID=A0A939T7V4_9ACTN|nr:hypothetical protein [Actinomadura barringtoniae]MBO2449677.1 hypothetical protein [Actinomadura barringtoniae]
MASRRVRLPGADEIFRPTVPEPPARRIPPEPRPVAVRPPTGRQRHDSKITVYISADELLDLEKARLTLRAEHDLAVDRGRLVREAVAAVLADFEANGPQSTLVRRLSTTP